jgi:hypothetical protein
MHELEQWRIQSWIERIPRHVQEVIRLDGDHVVSDFFW